MLNYPEIRNLSIEDLYGQNNFSILDYKATITDFAILNGGLYADFNKKEIANAERFGYYWTDIQKEENAICISTPLGFDTGSFVKTRFIGIRPVISKNYLEQITEYNQNVENNTIILECGEYPKQAV